MTQPNDLQAAVDHYRGGRWREAEAACRAILARDRKHCQAHYLLGILAQQSGNHQAAVEYFCQAATGDPKTAAYHVAWGDSLQALEQGAAARRSYLRALELDPGCIAAHYRLGQSLQASGELAAAAVSFRELLKHEPDHLETHNDLALVLRASGDDHGAEQLLRRAIELFPDFAAAHGNLGSLLHEHGQLDAAVAELERVTHLCPHLAPAHFNLANALRTAGDTQRALWHYRRAIELDTSMAAAYNNLGTLLQTLGDREQAISALRSAVRLDERLVDAHLNLALALQQQGDLLAAADHYRRAIALRPDVASAHYNLGLVRQGLRDWSAADACYHEALRLDPKYVEPRVALGINRQAVGEDDAAMQWFDSALAIDAEAAEAHCNRGMLLLARGRFAEGWPEYRWIARCKPGRPLGAQPVWDGAPLAGKRVLVRSNQGTGDLLQYMRYLSCIRRRGAGTVYLAAPAPLHPLLAGSGVSKLVTEDTLPPYEVQSSIMLLPALFFDEAGWMADRVPYVRAARVRVAEWHQWLAGYQGFRVGICWQGNPEFAWDGWRSAPLSAFLPIADTPGVKLFSLQRGYGSEQLDQLARRRGIVELPAEFDGPQGAFMDTAAVLENLDLVITTDTAMAHLAGAMGVRTWVALSFAPEWRWQRQGEASPWYPTMKLFRQTTRGDWASVFDRMSEELRGIVG